MDRDPREEKLSEDPSTPPSVRSITNATSSPAQAKPDYLSPENFRELFSANPNPMWIYDLETLSFLAVNGTAVANYGYSEAEFLAMTIKDIRPVKDVGRLLAHVAQERPLLQHSGEWQHLTKDGRIIDVEITSHVLETQARRAVLVTAVDVSKRTEAVRALRKTSDRLKSMLDASSTILYALAVAEDNSVSISWVGDNVTRILGYTMEEVMHPRWWIDHVHPDDQEIAAPMVPTVLEKGASIEEYRFFRKDGTILWTHDELNLRPAQGDEQAAIVGTWTDVTHLKQAEERMRRLNVELEERVAERTAQLQRRYHLQKALADIELAINQKYELQAVLDEIALQVTELLPASGGVGVSLWDEETEEFVIRASTVVSTSVELASQPVASHDTASRWIVNRRKPVIIEDLRQSRFGLTRQLTEYNLSSFAGYPLIHGDKVLGVLYALSREQRSFDADDQQFLTAMATRATNAIVKVRLYEDLETANQGLSAQSEQLQTANRELETFTYSVSHDLKAPLRAIHGYSQLLLESQAERLDEEGQLFLHSIHGAAERMNTLIEDLLAYARLERRSMKAQLVAPGELVASILEDKADLIEQRGIKVLVDIPFGLVTADFDGLSIALRNLLGNAIKFTRDAAQPVIEVGGSEEKLAHVLWIKDNGIGFEPEFRERIFEIFQRLHVSDDYPGTGIGLAMVGKAMERMGGRVWANSALGEGATFYLELPRPAEDEQAGI